MPGKKQTHMGETSSGDCPMRQSDCLAAAEVAAVSAIAKQFAVLGGQIVPSNHCLLGSPSLQEAHSWNTQSSHERKTATDLHDHIRRVSVIQRRLALPRERGQRVGRWAGASRPNQKEPPVPVHWQVAFEAAALRVRH